MFEEFELKLPGPTQAAFSIASFIANYTLLAVGELLVSIGVVIGVLKFTGFVLDHLERNRLIAFLRLGTKKNLGAMARWTGALSELLAIGTPEPLAVTTAGIASQRPWLRQQSVRLAQEVAGTGYRWSERWYARSFARSAIVALDLHSEGIASASLLRDLAQSYAIRWCGRGDIFYGWMGPILMLFIAKLIFFIVVSLFMPLISLITSLSM
jgi:type II secretory pathway component PulF